MFKYTRSSTHFMRNAKYSFGQQKYLMLFGAPGVLEVILIFLGRERDVRQALEERHEIQPHFHGRRNQEDPEGTGV